MRLSKLVSASLISFSTSILYSFPAISEEIVVMGYRGVFEDNFKSAVVEPFQKEHPDIKVIYYGVQNTATMLGNMRAQKDAPQTDAAILDISAANILLKEGLIRELDTSKLSNYADLGEFGREIGGYGPPLTYDTLTLMYNTKAFPEKPDSWDALWDEKVKDRIIVPSEGGGDIQAILMMIIADKMEGGKGYKESLQAGVDKLVKLAPHVQTWEPKPDTYTLVANGSADLGIGWNARTQFYADKTGGLIDGVAPVEGTAAQINVISATANRPSNGAVETFINYAIDPTVQARFSKLMYYAPTNTKTVLDDATQKRIPLLNPELRSNLIPVNWIEIGDIRQTLLEPWRRNVLPAGR